MTVHPRHFDCVSIKQPALQVTVIRFKRSEPFVNVQKDFRCEPAGNVTVPELTLSINVTIEFVGVARKCRVISEDPQGCSSPLLGRTRE